MYLKTCLSMNFTFSHALALMQPSTTGIKDTWREEDAKLGSGLFSEYRIQQLGPLFSTLRPHIGPLRYFA